MWNLGSTFRDRLEAVADPKYSLAVAIRPTKWLDSASSEMFWVSVGSWLAVRDHSSVCLLYEGNKVENGSLYDMLGAHLVTSAEEASEILKEFSAEWIAVHPDYRQANETESKEGRDRENRVAGRTNEVFGTTHQWNPPDVTRCHTEHRSRDRCPIRLGGFAAIAETKRNGQQMKRLAVVGLGDQINCPSRVQINYPIRS